MSGTRTASDSAEDAKPEQDSLDMAGKCRKGSSTANLIGLIYCN